jgi:ribosomal-protein-alanine N-acetyltransferase
VLLRQAKNTDLVNMLEIATYDGQRASNNEDVLKMLEKTERDYQNGTSINWCLADPVSDELIGFCGYYRGFENGTGELGCVLRPAFRGQGFMNEAMQTAVHFGLKKMGLQHVVAVTTQQNQKAIALLERLGFVHTPGEDSPKGLQHMLPGMKQGQMLFLFSGKY